MPDNRRPDHIGEAAEMVRTAREVAEEVAQGYLCAQILMLANKAVDQPSLKLFTASLADAIERGINKYLEEHR